MNESAKSFLRLLRALHTHRVVLPLARHTCELYHSKEPTLPLV